MRRGSACSGQSFDRASLASGEGGGPNSYSGEPDHVHQTPKADTSQTPSSLGTSTSADPLGSLGTFKPESRGNIIRVQTSRCQGDLGAGTKPRLATGVKVISLISLLFQTHMVMMATVKPLEHQMRKLRSRDIDDISKVTQQADSNSLECFKIF